MRPFRLLLATAALFVTCAADAAPAQQPTRDVVLHLRVAGDTTSVRNATVTVDHTIAAGKTDAAGTVRLRALHDGDHVVEAVAIGYTPLLAAFTTDASIAQPVDIEIERTSQPLDTVKVKGAAVAELRLFDFDRRRTRGLGNFLTRAQLDSSAGRSIASVLRAKVGATMIAGLDGSLHIASAVPCRSGAKGAPGFSEVVRDGVRLYPTLGGGDSPDLDKLIVDDLDAVEFYRRPALLPVELRDGASDCGVLVLWSRGGLR